MRVLSRWQFWCFVIAAVLAVAASDFIMKARRAALQMQGM